MKNEKTKKIWRYISFAGIFLFLVGVGVLLIFVGPKQIIAEIGPNNSYYIVVGVALLGGVSSFTSTSFYATVVTFAAGGLNPFIMGPLAGVAMAVGDSLFYFLGSSGRKAFLERYENKIDRLESWLEKRPRWVMPVIIYVYTGFTPFPGDIIMVTLALINYPYKKVIIPTILGNITLITIMAVAAYHGIKLFSGA